MIVIIRSKGIIKLEYNRSRSDNNSKNKVFIGEIFFKNNNSVVIQKTFHLLKRCKKFSSIGHKFIINLYKK